MFPWILFTAYESNFFLSFCANAICSSKEYSESFLFHFFFSTLNFVHVNFSYSRAFLAKVGRMKLALWISAL